MSSTYEALCLSHDPALLIEGTWHVREVALDAVARRAGFLDEHAGCDLLVARYSGGLVEVGCPPSTERHPGASTHPHVAQWVDACWLRIAATVLPLAESHDALDAAMRRISRCWTPKRLERLRVLLEVSA